MPARFYAVLFFTTAALAQPRLDIQAKRFDFGEVEKGDKIRHSFAFRNGGTADLVIKEVTPG